MAQAHFITQKESDWLMESTSITSKNKGRDLCLLAFFLASTCFVLEINRIQIGDILMKNGKLKKQLIIRGVNGFNGEVRIIFVTNKTLRQYINNYLKIHKAKGNHPDYFLGLNPDAPLFNFAITSKTEDGKTSYAAASLGNHIKKLLRDGGIQQPSVHSGRRTFANRLYSMGMDMSYIHHLLGNRQLETTRKTLINNAVDMGKLAAHAF